MASHLARTPLPSYVRNAISRLLWPVSKVPPEFSKAGYFKSLLCVRVPLIVFGTFIASCLPYLPGELGVVA